MPKPMVALDLDNVIVDILESARHVISHDVQVSVSEIRDTGVYSAPFTHEDPEIADKVVTSHDFWQRAEVLATATPLPGALQAVNRLDGNGQLVGYITRRSPRAQGITRAWLELQGFPMKPVHFVGHDDADMNQTACKAEICIRIGATHLVDDSQKEAASAIARGVSVILIDHPLGRKARDEWLARHPDITLARDAGHAIDMLITD